MTSVTGHESWVASDTVCVVGLGKIGLPLAVQCAGFGAKYVLGCDINPDIVAAINDGRTDILEEGLAEALSTVVRQGRLRATIDTVAAVRAAQVVVVIVPVGLTSTREVDFAAIDAAAASVGQGLQPGTLVLFESTVPVGTTRDRLAGILSAHSRLMPGVDFLLAFSPERVYSGRVFRDLATYPKVVGGIDAESTERAAAFYRAVLNAEVLELSTAEAAEYTKLVETTYRDVNIALANEFALFAEKHGIDVQESIKAANTQPFSHVHQPSVGVGGHCIPVYPHFLFTRWEGFRLPPLARTINDGMSTHAVDMLEQTLGTLMDRRILILGLTYRENVKEVAFSAARPIAQELRRRGVQVLGHDPTLSDAEQRAQHVEPVWLQPPPHVDAIVIQAFHKQYKDLDWATFEGLQVLLDGRNGLAPEAQRVLHAQGIHYLRVGLGRAVEGSG